MFNRIQFPLMLAWGCTLHKMQPIILEKAAISFDLLRRRNLQYDQMSIELSRVISLNGFYLISKFNYQSRSKSQI